MKRTVCMCLLLLAVLMLSMLPAFAAEGYVVDQAGLFDASEESSLNSRLQALSAQMACDVRVLTVQSLGGKTPRDFADDWYDDHDYGSGTDKSGIMLLVAMDERDVYMTTSGNAIGVFTNARIDAIYRAVKEPLGDGDYADAASLFADRCEYYLQLSLQGNDSAKEPFAVGEKALIAAGVGLLVALISVSSMKGKLKSVRRQPAAFDYMKRDSMVVARSHDMFLYRTISRVARPRENSGSSTHRSSSGRTHGGGGGKF